MTKLVLVLSIVSMLVSCSDSKDVQLQNKIDSLKIEGEVVISDYKLEEMKDNYKGVIENEIKLKKIRLQIKQLKLQQLNN
jgi:hypothetical protein